MTKKIISIFLLFIAVACSEELTFVSINVWSGLDYIGTLRMGEYETKSRREERYRILIGELKKIDPDVIAVNEANKLPGYARRLARDLGCDQIHTIGNAGIKIFGFGIPTNLLEGDAILVKKRLNLKRVGKCKLSGDKFGIYCDCLTFHFSETNFAIVGSIEVEGKKIYIANTHLHASVLVNVGILGRVNIAVSEGNISQDEADAILREYEDRAKRRYDEAQKVMNLIVKTIPSDSPIILMGDFNDIYGSDVYNKIVEDGRFYDSFLLLNPEDSGFTWNPEVNTNINPTQLSVLTDQSDFKSSLKCFNDGTPRRIDYIFVSKNILSKDIIRSEVILNKPSDGIYASDHFGVMTKVFFK